MNLVLVVLVVLLLCGGVGYYGRGAGWSPTYYGGGSIGLILVVLLVLFLVGGFR